MTPNQLTAEHRTGSVPYRNTFTYDSVGNRLVKNESGARTTYSYDAANQLKTSIDAGGITTFTFDANGNQQLVQAPNNDRTTTVWDYENRATLVELPSGIRNTMAYEPDGLRVKLEDSTGTKKFIWDNQNYLAESDENNDINVLYTNEPNTYGNLISQHRKSSPLWTPSYYHYEALGSTRQLTNNAEAITDQYLYDAWGNVISSSGSTPNPFQFTGKVGYYFDVDTGNQYIRARIYSPIIGRWLSVDPLGFIDGVNLYRAFFIPKKTDPSGRQTLGPWNDIPFGPPTIPTLPGFEPPPSNPFDYPGPFNEPCAPLVPCVRCEDQPGGDQPVQPKDYVSLMGELELTIPQGGEIEFKKDCGVKDKEGNTFAITCGPGSTGSGNYYMCLPTNITKCRAKALLVHEFVHIQQYLQGDNANEKDAYTAQCDELANQNCRRGKRKEDYIRACLDLIGKKSSQKGIIEQIREECLKH